MPNPDEIRKTMHAYLERLSAGDTDGVLELYGDDPTVEDPVGGAVQQGREAVRTFYAAAGANLTVELTGPIRVAGNECAMPMLAEVDLGDRKMYIDVIDVMELDDAGRITSMRAFWNPAEGRPTRER